MPGTLLCKLQHKYTDPVEVRYCQPQGMYSSEILNKISCKNNNCPIDDEWVTLSYFQLVHVITKKEQDKCH